MLVTYDGNTSQNRENTKIVVIYDFVCNISRLYVVYRYDW